MTSIMTVFDSLFDSNNRIGHCMACGEDKMKHYYLNIIRFSLEANQSDPESLFKTDWEGFYEFCHRHSIEGVILSGIDRANIRIDQKVLFEWIALSEKIRRRNEILNKRTVEISDWFRERGYRSVILKGQANSLMYPNPEARCPGDIDIWVEGEQKTVIKMIMEQWADAHYSIHHIDMPAFKDVSVEVHYRPIYLRNWFLDKKLARYISSIEEPQFSNKVQLEGKEIGHLTDDFNAVYEMLHMYAHFFTSRNSFKQFIDYYYLLKRGLSEQQKADVAARFEEFKVDRYARGIMWIMKDTLGLDEGFLIVEPSERIGRAILRESKRYGTFSSRKLLGVLQEFLGNLRVVWLFPGEVIISPLFLVWHQWWKLRMRLALR